MQIPVVQLVCVLTLMGSTNANVVVEQDIAANILTPVTVTAAVKENCV